MGTPTTVASYNNKKNMTSIYSLFLGCNGTRKIKSLSILINSFIEINSKQFRLYRKIFIIFFGKGYILSVFAFSSLNVIVKNDQKQSVMRIKKNVFKNVFM